jgi:hypothetical protein
MKWEEIRKGILDHLATVSGEQFDEELRLAGIENQRLVERLFYFLFCVLRLQMQLLLQSYSR